MFFQLYKNILSLKYMALISLSGSFTRPDKIFQTISGTEWKVLKMYFGYIKRFFLFKI